MEKTKNDVAPYGAGACGGSVVRPPANLLKAEEKEYEEWRRKKLGDCYYERLDYSVCNLYDVEVGSGVLNILKPGDKVVIEFDVEDIDFIDPCFVKKKVDEETYYVEGYVPFYSEHCRCKRAECDDFVILRLPLYIRGQVKASSKFVVVRYMGNGVAEIVETNDYDYYFGVDFYDHLESVQGATWHAIYDWDSYRIYNLRDNRVLEYSTCCFDDYYSSTYIVAMLIKRGETARVRYYGVDEKDKLYEDVISTTGFPPTIENYLVDN